MAELAYVRIRIGARTFRAVVHNDSAPRTCEAIARLLPMHRRVIHARWSGEAVWVPFGEQTVEIPWEDATSHPAPGQLLLYPGGLSEMEILLPYGAAMFSSKVGQLAGNRFASIVERVDELRSLGRTILYEGAQDFVIEAE